MLNSFDIDNLILAALKEDMPLGDITTDNLVDISSTSEAKFIAKEEGVIAGLDVSERSFLLLDKNIVFERLVNDGDIVKYGDIIAIIKGNTRAMLKAERTALNFLQRLSGIATSTRKYCDRVKEFPVRVVDTRKTTPGLRFLEKYAVKTGGGHNHRFCLSDGVLIKDNHIKAAGGITKAIEILKDKIPHTIKIEVETESLSEVQEALAAGADIIMLDNMKLPQIKEAVELIAGRALIEDSGNVNIETVYDLAAAGVDIISIGRITHSVEALDISMKFV